MYFSIAAYFTTLLLLICCIKYYLCLDVINDNLEMYVLFLLLPNPSPASLLFSCVVWVVWAWYYSSCSMCQNWASTSPDSFTSLMRTIRKCKRTSLGLNCFVICIIAFSTEDTFSLYVAFQVRHVGSQLCVYTDGHSDPDVPGCWLWFGSCREPGSGLGDGQLQHCTDKVMAYVTHLRVMIYFVALLLLLYNQNTLCP